ncbi:hypothetical protein AC340_05840 [Salmonella enterica subsp. enterica]|nr:hypothetical protein [Salmonella enterica subsp. enterica]EBX8440603.1 hypothetical protein [Salmonella enterica subsp. enterica serovar Oranienburg]ECO5282892.1 hypothetical protein [Salmonella enterica]ECO5359657.1 hypothetical protein [Salmonella enterica]GAS10296.1 hypothetical protein NGUA26_01849 [Salmonella enterica]
MFTTSSPRYVVVSKSISKFTITQDVKDKNTDVLISIIYDLINGTTDEVFINNIEKASIECIEKNSFSKKFKACINNIPPEETHPTRNTPDPK